MPNTFSPNGDGVNDIFKPSTNCTYTLIELTIYNRWGEKILNKKDSWNEFYQNASIPNGIYLWELLLKDTNGRNYYSNGTVHVIK